MITQFFAVTQTGIYQVTADGPYKSTAEKVFAKSGPNQPPGQKIGFKLGDDAHYMIGIGYCLQAYAPERHGLAHPKTDFERDYSRINTAHWGNSSSQIVGLFMTFAEARDCSRESDGTPCADQWLDSTKAVLAAIGDEHPSFFVSHLHNLGLLECREQVAA